LAGRIIERGTRAASLAVRQEFTPLLLAGPTATGKSEVALRLAELLGGEIVSVDSMQVYRGMDIGTAKSSPAERARVPHHLIDVADVTEPFDAARFVRLAREAVSDIQSRGRLPILCGGTGLYFKAFLDGLGEAPSPQPGLRAELEALPLAALLRELEQGDPAACQSIDRNNPRRVIRAVEVLRLTGKPFSAQRARWSSAPDTAAFRCFVLNRAAADLHRRIETRVDGMFRRGLVAETEQLLRRGLAQNRSAMQALGYRQVAEHLRGERALPETIELVKTRTRQFAKRQMTWFRKYAPWTWLEAEAESRPEKVAQSILEKLNQESSSARPGAPTGWL
jgi:tRNA dimethylallyltransferase